MALTHYFNHVLYLSGSQLAEMDRRPFVRCAGRRSYVQKKALSTVKNTSPKISYALKLGSSFALERPITFDSLRNTLQAAYGMIVRERRRYFRYPISVPAAVSKRSPKRLICIVEIASVLLLTVGLLAAVAD